MLHKFAKKILQIRQVINKVALLLAVKHKSGKPWNSKVKEIYKWQQRSQLTDSGESAEP